MIEQVLLTLVVGGGLVFAGMILGSQQTKTRLDKTWMATITLILNQLVLDKHISKETMESFLNNKSWLKNIKTGPIKK